MWCAYMDPEHNKTFISTLAKRLVVAVLLAFLCVAAGWFIFRYEIQKMCVDFADEQTAMFDQMRERSLRANNAIEIVGYLDYATHYYPSGTKQEKGSPLDEIVERGRRSAIRDIIAHLRTQTGRDLGDDPDLWIAEFAKRK